MRFTSVATWEPARSLAFLYDHSVAVRMIYLLHKVAAVGRRAHDVVLSLRPLSLRLKTASYARRQPDASESLGAEHVERWFVEHELCCQVSIASFTM